MRENHKADGGGEQSGPEPGAPADIHTEAFLREVRAERVRGHTGEEQSARDRRELEARHDEVITDLFTGLTRGGTHHIVNGLRDRENDAAGTSRHGRHSRSHHKVSAAQRIRDTGGRTAELREHQVRDTAAKTGLDEAERQKVRRENHPHRAGREAGE